MRYLSGFARLIPIIAILAASNVFARDMTWKDCELAERDPDRSISACSKLLSAGRAKSAAFHNRGVAYAAKGNLDRALADISEGIRLDPGRAYRWQERGEIYHRKGNFSQAIRDLNEAIRLDPTHAFRFHARGNAYRSTGDLTRAIADYSEAIRLDPIKRLFRFYDRGNAFRDARQYDRALADYEIAIQLEPANAWVFLERGRMYAKMGQIQHAARDFNAALAIDPTNTELRAAVQQASAELNTGRPIEGKTQKVVSSGSAFFVSPEGHIVTNAHVVADCAYVRSSLGGQISRIAIDQASDLAIYVASEKSRSWARIRGGRGARAGEPVVAVGFPLSGLLGSDLIVTTGIISALSGLGNDRRTIQITAPVQPGNSGGPLLGEDGSVVGVVVGKLDAMKVAEVTGDIPQNVNFAVSLGTLQSFLNANDIPYALEETKVKRSPADITAEATRYTTLLECIR